VSSNPPGPDVDALLAGVRERHNYEAWAGRVRSTEHIFIWRFRLNGAEVPGWRPHRLERVEGSPPSVHGVWISPGGTGQAAVGMDIVESPSREAASGVLLRLLGQFQLPIPTAPLKDQIGDVAFGSHGAGPVAFLRGNLTIALWSAGRQEAPVRDIAADLDRWLTHRPPVRAERELQALDLHISTTRSGSVTHLELEPSRADTGPLWFKLISEPGEVQLSEGKPVYKDPDGNGGNVTVYAFAGPQVAAREEAHLNPR
jgi:hypothetical protein